MTNLSVEQREACLEQAGLMWIHTQVQNAAAQNPAWLLTVILRGWQRQVRRQEELPDLTRQRRQAAIFVRRVAQKDVLKTLRRMYERLIHIVSGSATGIRLLETWTVAYNNMPWCAIKLCTYNGACLRWDTSKDVAEKGYRWHDPGNYTYAVVWHLILKLARHEAARKSMAHAPEPTPSTSRIIAAQFGIVADRCYERWPRVNADHFNELVGDLMELALARGYSDDTLMHIIRDVSSLSAAVSGLYNLMEYDNPLHNRPFNVRINPKQIADILLTAHSCHRLGDWSRFNRLVQSPELVMSSEARSATR